MRLQTPINKHLAATESWKTCTPELRAAFREVMQGKAYGIGPTLHAWHFFYCGWFKAGGRTHSVIVPGAQDHS
jgi:hypothetical protein